MVLIWISGMRTEPSEKEIIFSREIPKGGILETRKRESQKTGQMQVCLIESVTKPQEQTHPLFLARPKPGPSAPMIRDSANVCEGKSKGLRGTKSICFNYLGNRIVTRGRSKNPPGLEGNKSTETEGRGLGLDILINPCLRE